MINYVFCALVGISVIFAFVTGQTAALSSAALAEAGGAVQLVLGLCGMLCLWNGLLAVAEKAGLTAMLSRLLAPVLRVVFRGLHHESPAAKAISMNISANLLGLGNAATPLGIAAMKELEKSNRCSGIASNHMVTFVVLNTASIQLIPTTTAALRLVAGCQTPFDILPAVWATSLASVLAGLLACRLLEGGKRRRASL